MKNKSELSSLSKVKQDGRSQFINASHYWLIGIFLVVFILLLVWFSNGKSYTKSNRNIVNLEQQDYSVELKENLEKLEHDEQDVAEQARVQSNAAIKKYIARQHAPTSVYSSRVSTNVLKSSSLPLLVPELKAMALAHPQYSIVSGEFFHAILETAINSDLPGRVRAVVSRPVYAYNGNKALIPAGSRLIGEYASKILDNQRRLFIIWNRIILPSGISIRIDSPSADTLGRSGQAADHISTYFFKRFARATLLSVIGAGLSGYNVDSLYTHAVAESFQHTASQTLQRGFRIQPTLRIYHGTRINVFVAHDLSFYGVMR